MESNAQQNGYQHRCTEAMLLLAIEASVENELGCPVIRDMCCRGAMDSIKAGANNIRYIGVFGVCTYLGIKYI